MNRYFSSSVMFAAALFVGMAFPGNLRAALLIHYDFSQLGTPVSGSNFEVLNQGTLGAAHNGDAFSQAVANDVKVVDDAMFSKVAQFGNNNGNFIRIGDSGASGGIPGGKLTTIAAWYKGTAFEQMFDQRDTPGPRAVISGAGDLNIRVFDGTWSTSNYPAANLEDGSWHHWAMTIDGNTGAGQLYVNGAAVGTLLTGLTSWNLVAGDTTIWGTNISSLSLTSAGLHHDIRIYNEVLGAAEIRALAARPALRVDFNENDNGISPTQDGFVSITQDGSPGISTDFGLIGISFNSMPGDRDRGPVTGAPQLSDLARDFVFNQLDTLDITLTGIEAGGYKFTGYFHDNTVDQGTVDIFYSVDGGANFQTGVLGVDYSFGAATSSVGMASFLFQANGIDNVVIRLDGSGTNNVINGFELIQIPEPHSLLLLVIGLTALSTIRRIQWRPS